MIRDGDFVDHRTFQKAIRARFKKIWPFEKSVGLDWMKISVFQNNLHTRHSGYFTRQKINRTQFVTSCKDSENSKICSIEIPVCTDTCRQPLGIPRPNIDSILRDSGPIVPSPYSGSRDVSLPAGISVVNKSSNVEGFTENYDRSSGPIRNPCAQTVAQEKSLASTFAADVHISSL
jgi:hypothetical protein